MYNARVKFYKEVERDNYEKGCYGGIATVCDENFEFEFEDKNDLLKKLAEWTSNHFDVEESIFLKHIDNECENNRFDYAQPEDENGDFTHITKENPEGYCAMYFYYVETFKKVSYKF